MKSLILVISILIGHAALAADSIYNPLPLDCNFYEMQGWQFHISCGGPQQLGKVAEQATLAAAKIKCAPEAYEQTSETQVLRFLGSIYAEASFRCR
jgi:hypothetical protein